jgi:hypothetical protein
LAGKPATGEAPPARRARPGLVPPAAIGIFFEVPAADPSAPWIEQLFHEGITAGCGGGDFCPNDGSTRAEMAAFLVRTFALPLPFSPA